MFPCDKCGACCRNIGVAFFAKDMIDNEGGCKYLDSETNLCRQYSNRPVFCNVDEYYDKYLQTTMTRKEFYRKNKEICEQLRRLEDVKRSNGGDKNCFSR